MQTKNLLWSVPRSFLPVSDGASRANASLLESCLKACDKENLDLKITLLLFVEDLNEVDSLRESYLQLYKVEDIVFCKKNILSYGLKRIGQVIRNLLSEQPLTASFFDLNVNSNTLNDLKTRSFDYVLCDGLHTFCGLKNIFSDAEFIYRSHNVEYDLWNLENTNIISHFILSSQKKKMKKLELDLINRSCAVWTISNEDRTQYREDIGRDQRDHEISHIEFIPMGIPFSDRLLTSPAQQLNKTFHFVFLGKLDWYPNTEGLKWFLDNVAPFLLDNIKISIVGKGDFPQTDYTALKNIHFLGFVKDLEDIYQDCDACLIPIFSGSGTRIKVLEALSAGVPLLSTSFGIQGSGLQDSHCKISNDAQEWIDSLNNWNRPEAKSKAKLAQLDLYDLYSGKSLEKALLNILV